VTSPTPEPQGFEGVRNVAVQPDSYDAAVSEVGDLGETPRRYGRAAARSCSMRAGDGEAPILLNAATLLDL
jgi:hypothetical protein